MTYTTGQHALKEAEGEVTLPLRALCLQKGVGLQGFLVSSLTVYSSRILYLKVDLECRHKSYLFQGQGELREKDVYTYMWGEVSNQGGLVRKSRGQG